MKQLKRKSKFLTAAILLLVFFLFTGCGSGIDDYAERDNSFVENEDTSEAPVLLTPDTDNTLTKPEVIPEVNIDEKEFETEYEEEDAVKINLSDGASASTSSNASISGDTVTIGKAGTYVISGTLSDGQIVVKKDITVHLIFNGVNIKNTTTSAFWAKKDSVVTITLMENTENRLEDAANYILEEGEDEPNACLFAKSALTINGSGKLEIVSKDADIPLTTEEIIAIDQILQNFMHEVKNYDKVSIRAKAKAKQPY